MDAAKRPKLIKTFSLSPGLDGQDTNLDVLQEHYLMLQNCTVECANPDIDLLTFALSTHSFSVVMMTERAVCEQPSDEAKDSEDTQGHHQDERKSFDADSIQPLSNVVSDEEPVISTQPWITSDSYRRQMDLVDRWQAGLLSAGEDAESRVDLSSKEPDIAMHSIDGDEETVQPRFSRDDDLAPLLTSHLRDEHEAKVSGQYQDTLDDFSEKLDRTVDRTAAARVTSSGFQNSFLPSTRFGAPLGQSSRGQFTTARPRPDSPMFDIVDPFDIMDEPLSIGKRAPLPSIPPLSPVRTSGYNPYANPPAVNWAPNPGYGSKITRSEPVGIVYLASSQDYNDPLRQGELGFGAYVLPEYRFVPGVLELMNEMVAVAFKDPQCARLQAIVVDNQDKYENLKFFTSLGFTNEGTRRRGFFSPIRQEYKDAIYFGMLATDWSLDQAYSVRKLRTTTVWDEIIARHQWERDDLIKLESKSLKRSSSMETIRNAVAAYDAAMSDTQSLYSARSSVAPSQSSARSQVLPAPDQPDHEERFAFRRPPSRTMSIFSDATSVNGAGSAPSDWELGSEAAFNPSSRGSRVASLPSSGDELEGYVSSDSQWDLLSDSD